MFLGKFFKHMANICLSGVIDLTIYNSSFDGKRKLLMYAKNIFVASLLILLAACSIIGKDNNILTQQEEEIKNLREKIRIKSEQIKQLNISAASLKEELELSESANKTLKQDYRLAKQEYNRALESSGKLRSELDSLEGDYKGVLAEIDATEQKLFDVLDEKKDEQEKTRTLINEKSEQIKQLNKSAASLREELKISDSTNMTLKQDYKLAKQEYNKALESSQKLRSELDSLESGYKEALAEINATEQKLSDALDEKKDKQEKTQNFQNAIDKIKLDLQEGNMVYDPPKEMIKGDVKTLTLEISPDKAFDELKQAFSRREGAPIDAIKVEPVKISDFMVATLTATSGIAVRSLDKSDTIPISSIDPNIWRWEVEAKEKGVQKLFLKVGIVLENNFEKPPSYVWDKPREILVTVSGARSIADFWRKNWKYLIQVLIIPLIIFAWEKIKKYRLKKKSH